MVCCARSVIPGSTTCQKVSEETYKFLLVEETVHWYCRGCNRGVKQVLTTMTEMRIEMTRIQNEIKTIKKEFNDSIRDMKSELKVIKDELKKSRKEEKWEGELNEMKKELKASDVKLETAIEANLVETAEITKFAQMC